MSQNVGVIHCPTERCVGCLERTESGCQKLDLLSVDTSKTIVIIEKTRGLLHLWLQVNNLPINAPWYSESWESVFVGFNDSLFDKCENIIGIYLIEPYLCVYLNQKNSRQIRFEFKPLVKTPLELSLLDTLVNEFRATINPSVSARENVSNQQNRRVDEVSKYLQKHIPEMNENTKARLSQITAYSMSVLGRLVPILLDELTEEVYLDGPETALYFDHQIYGRCVTGIMYLEHEIPRIITFMRSESNQHLDRANPSLKMELDFLGLSLRLSASVPPLSMTGLSLEVRRARQNPYSIRDLIQNESVTPEAAAILILAITSRLNITITGGPGTGKTTLLNALDMITPSWWRKIYIEDAVESRFLENQHQVVLRVDPVDEQCKKLSKSEEIVKCLHRSPDYLILGEIQTAEHSKAVFQAISAGLRTIQTCHSDSASSLISRWILSHGIDSSNLGLMDLIVTLERPRPSESSRRIKEIAEIRREKKNGLISFLGISTVYDVTYSDGLHCAQDGAIQNLARAHGIYDYQKVIDGLAETIRNFSDRIDIKKLGEELWSNGHPIQFDQYRSKLLHS